MAALGAWFPECVNVGANTWAPLGSSEPQRCPATGFYCPGTKFDNVNKVPGALPILVSIGNTVSSTETMVDEVYVCLKVEHPPDLES